MAGKQPNQPIESPSLDCLAFAVRKAARVMTQIYDAALAPSGLKSTQFTVLNAVSVADDVGISRLAEMLVMDRTTLTRNLKPLVREGLVETGPGRDRRSRFVRLTARGRDRLEEALPLWRRAQEQARKRLGTSRVERLRRDLAEAARHER